MTSDFPRNPEVSSTRIRRPCANCPWRIDAPRGYWDPQHFTAIWQNCQDDGANIMLCHKANNLPEEERPRVPCQGWIRVMGFHAIGVRLLALRHQVSPDEITDRGGPPLFPSFTAMLLANKIPLPQRSRVVPSPHEVPMPKKSPKKTRDLPTRHQALRACEIFLKKQRPNHQQAQDGETWTCACGRHFVHVCDEAEGCRWDVIS